LHPSLHRAALLAGPAEVGTLLLLVRALDSLLGSAGSLVTPGLAALLLLDPLPLLPASTLADPFLSVKRGNQ
jgi:hypothetical protein